MRSRYTPTRRALIFWTLFIGLGAVAGAPGFWWCGRYGLMRRAMPIEPVDIDLSACDHVTICSSI